MNRFPKNVYLPQNKGLDADLLRVLDEAFREVALVTREIQAPPMLHVNMNAVDQNLTVGATPNVLQFILTDTTNCFDTHGWWNSSSYRYLPKETGYYHVDYKVRLTYAATGIITAGIVQARVDKNGAAALTHWVNKEDADAISNTFMVSGIVYLNGTTDYLDFSVLYDAGTALVASGGKQFTSASIAFLGAPQIA